MRIAKTHFYALRGENGPIKRRGRIELRHSRVALKKVAIGQG
jgi:hypothetical protein